MHVQIVDIIILRHFSIQDILYNIAA